MTRPRLDWRHPLCALERLRARIHGPAPSTPEALRRHAEANAAGLDTYVDPVSGRRAFTAHALMRLGACCGNDCRHCPYPGD